MRIEGQMPMQIARAYGVAPTKPVQPPAPVRDLVAGQVQQGVNFATETAPRPNADGALTLYTRAADKVEAAVSVAVGRGIDVRG